MQGDAREHGGQGGTAVEQAIYSEEVDGTAATSLRAENLDRWIAGAALLAARAGGAQ